MLYSTHQPSLFPHAGFWFRFSWSDVFGFTTDVKMDYAGYQNRVPFGNGWLTVPVEKGSKHKLLSEARVSEGYLANPNQLLDTVVGRMSKKDYPHRDVVGCLVERLIKETEGETSLCAINCKSIEIVANHLDLRRSAYMLPCAEYEGETKHDRLFERLSRFNAGPFSTYLAGPGTYAYIDKDSIPWGWHLIRVEQTSDKKDTGQSVLHFIGKYDNPLTEMTSRFRLCV